MIGVKSALGASTVSDLCGLVQRRIDRCLKKLSGGHIHASTMMTFLQREVYLPGLGCQQGCKKKEVLKLPTRRNTLRVLVCLPVEASAGPAPRHVFYPQ